MEVRCPGCHRAVSEWAHRCPGCGAGLAEAEPLAGPPAAAGAPAAGLPVGPGAVRSGAVRYGAVRSGAVEPGAVEPGAVRSGEVGAGEAVGEPVGAEAVEPLGRSGRLVPWPPAGRRRRLAAAVAVVAGAAAVTLAVVPGGAGSRRAPARQTPASAGPVGGVGFSALPAVSRLAIARDGRLARQELFVADRSGPRAVLANGTVLARLGGPTPSGGTPVAVAAGTVVYVAGGEAYRYGPSTRAPATPVGRASAVLGAGPGRVDLVSAATGATKVTTVAVGRVDTTTAVYTVATGDRPVAASRDGLIVETPGRVLDLLRAPGAAPQAVSTPVSRIVAVGGDELAWTSVAGCPLALTSDCPLHLTDLRTGARRPVPAGGAIGFGAGVFSPDGRTLAVLALPGQPQDQPGLDVDLVDPADGAVRQVGSVVVSGSSSPTLTWSASGTWLYFGSAGTFAAVDVSPPGGVLVPSGPVALPVSVDCCVVGL